MKVLHLTLKKKWFDMIASGEKKEEYREITPYWSVRLLDIFYPFEEPCSLTKFCENIVYDLDESNHPGVQIDPYKVLKGYRSSLKSFDVVHAYHGCVPSLKFPNFQRECKGIEIREGKEEWGAEPGKKYFVIKLGEIIDKQIPR